MPTPALPAARSSLTDSRTGAVSVEWYTFFSNMLQAAVDSGLLEAGAIDSILERLAALEDAEGGVVVGPVSVQVLGTLGNGGVTVRLRNDSEAPGNTYYYGTGPTGTKGWFTVSDAFEVETGELTRVVAADGVTTFGLEDTAVTPGDYTNANISVDQHGRITAATSGSSGGGSNPFAVASESWDFVKQGIVTSASVGSNFVTNSAVPHAYIAGAGATATLTSASGVPGICTLSTGTATNGYSRLYFCPPVVILGGGEIAYRTRIRIPTLSDATNRFGVGVVMANVIEGAGLQRIGAIYIDNTNAGQWVAQAINGGGTSSTNTTVAPTANTWMIVEIRVNAAGTSFELFIGANSGAMASAGTVSANIPSIALGLSVQITKSAGTAARTVDVDLADFRQTFTATR